MSEQDSLFREIDEDLRREQLAAMWNKYGVYILAGAVLIVAIVGGYNAYNWWTAKRAAETGQAHYAAIELVSEDKNAEALEAFNGLAAQGNGGYRTLARLEIAALHAQEGRKDEAVAAYEQVAAGGADAFLRDYARLQAATLLSDTASESDIRERVSGLIADTNPWRYSARELLALVAFRSGNLAESERIYAEILGDPASPGDMRRRAEAMMALMLDAPAADERPPQGSAGGPTQ